MSDQHPHSLRIEIDRPRLKKYLRLKSFPALLVPIVVFGALIGFSSISKRADGSKIAREEVVFLIAKSFAEGAGVGVGLTLLIYFPFAHPLADRRADTLDVSVEGSFLRLRQHTIIKTDRKLHFRSIVDYATTQSFLMRWCEVQALQMTTTAGGQNPPILIPGVMDCLKIRDLLAEIDSQREHQ